MLLQFKSKKESFYQQDLTIRNANNNYTEAYKELTKDFYL